MAESNKKDDKKTGGQQRIRIRLNSHDSRLIDNSTGKIIDAVRRTGAIISGPVLLPTRIRKYTVNRSVHIDKKSREQFEWRNHRRLIELVAPTAKTVDELRKLDLPHSVEVKIKLY